MIQSKTSFWSAVITWPRWALNLNPPYDHVILVGGYFVFLYGYGAPSLWPFGLPEFCYKLCIGWAFIIISGVMLPELWAEHLSMTSSLVPTVCLREGWLYNVWSYVHNVVSVSILLDTPIRALHAILPFKGNDELGESRM